VLKTLLDQLRDPTPEARIEALCALVMLEETEALPLLTQMWKTEQHPEVRQAIGWAGKQIHAAQQRGYTTIEGMAEAFRVHLVPDQKEIEEQRKMSQIQTNINIQQAKQYGSDESGRVIGSALKGAAIAGALGMVGGLGAGAVIGAMSPNIGPSTSLGGADSLPLAKSRLFRRALLRRTLGRGSSAWPILIRKRARPPSSSCGTSTIRCHWGRWARASSKTLIRHCGRLYSKPEKIFTSARFTGRITIPVKPRRKL